MISKVKFWKENNGKEPQFYLDGETWAIRIKDDGRFIMNMCYDIDSEISIKTKSFEKDLIHIGFDFRFQGTKFFSQSIEADNFEEIFKFEISDEYREELRKIHERELVEEELQKNNKSINDKENKGLAESK